MALKKCKECGKEVSTKAESCPNCGAVLKRKTSGCAGCLAVFIIGFIVLGVIGSLVDTDTASRSSNRPSTATRQDESPRDSKSAPPNPCRR